MIPREFEKKCKDELRRRIKVPSKNEHIITDDVHRIRYSIDKEIKNLPLDDLHLAEVLLELNMIQDAKIGRDNAVMMYRVVSEVVPTGRGHFTQRFKKEAVSRYEICFTEEDIINIAIREELKEVGGVVGMFKAKIIPFTFLAA